MTTPTTAPPADQESTSDEPHAVILSLDAERAARLVLLLCILAELAFLLLDYHVNYGRATDIGALRRMFNTAREDGLASWFAVTQTLLIALTLWLVYAVAKAGANPKRRAVGWLVLALFFTYMAVDDGAQIHERLGTTFKRLHEASGGSLDFFPSYTWQVVFLPVFAALGVFTPGLSLARARDERLESDPCGGDFPFGFGRGLGFHRGAGRRPSLERVHLGGGPFRHRAVDEISFRKIGVRDVAAFLEIRRRDDGNGRTLLPVVSRSPALACRVRRVLGATPPPGFALTYRGP